MIEKALLLLLGLINLAIASYNYDEQGADWATSGDSAYVEACAGFRQSPIDIIRKETIRYEGHEIHDFSFNYCENILGKLKNTGTTLKFETQDGQPDSSYMTGGPYGTTKYYFLQFHLHWGSESTKGSEHTIGGVQAPAELHLVHVNEKYVNLDGTLDAAAFDDGEGLAVLGILLQGGATEADWFDFISVVADDYSSEVETSPSLTQLVQRINPGYFDQFNYWHYEGSLTTPDCHEAVQWIVSERPLAITDAQLATLFELTYDNGGEDESLLNNFRHPQDTNCRKVNYVHLNDITEFQYECEDGFYVANVNNFECTDCDCYTPNTIAGEVNCGDVTGQCDCILGASGQMCDYCVSGYFIDYYDYSGSCEECNCNTSGTSGGSSSCNYYGQCNCATGYTGDKCDTCTHAYYAVGNTCNFCNCNGFGVETANWGFTKANYTYDFECADNTGDCGPCFPGFTGLQCDTCADDYEFISDSSSSHTYGQFINCRKACPEGWKLLSKNYRNNYDYWNYEDDESQEFQDHYNNYPNYCYQTVSQPLSFDEAIANCTGMGATLLEPQWSGESYNAIFATNDQFENDADPGQEHWVGIKYDGGSEANSFGWSYASTGDALIYSRWTFLDYGASVGCAAVYRNGDYQTWTTRSCSQQKPFICQRLSIVDTD